jgi:glutamate/tyrosine decarboxylase-like PLP-dependent enzyme
MPCQYGLWKVLILNKLTRDYALQSTNRKELWNDLVEIIETYFKQNDSKDTPVVNYLNGHDLKKELNLSIAKDSCGYNGVLDEVKNYLKYSVRTSHPQFNNQLSANIKFESLIGDLISSVGNATMATFEVAPVATLIEAKLVEEINKLIGFNDGDGIMLTGGSNANLMAIHCARENLDSTIKNKGNQGRDFAVFVSEEAHYSHKKAMMVMGLGIDNLILIKADANGKMMASDLDIKIESAKEAGKTPLMVCSTAGTTVFGAFDPLEEINTITKKHKLWHHVDGAWGGAVMFSKKYIGLMKGIEDVDSYTFDAHKLMGTGLITSFFTTRHKTILSEANSGGGSQYIFHDYENAEFDTGRKSIQCGRQVDSLKLWLLWKSEGHEGMENFINGQYEKQQKLVSMINENPRMKLIKDPEYLNVCFQIIPEDKSIDINQYNLNLRFKLMKEGKFMTNFSRLNDGTIFFRHIFANSNSESHHTEELIAHLFQLGN